MICWLPGDLFCDTFSALWSCGVPPNSAFRILCTAVPGHCRIVFADLHLLRVSFSDGVAQASRDQKRLLIGMLRAVRESTKPARPHWDSCQDLLPRPVARVVVSLSTHQYESHLWPLCGCLGPSPVLPAPCREPPWLKGHLFQIREINNQINLEPSPVIA